MLDAIFTLNNPNAPRLSPELAQEIGLNESILLLQIEFWIRTSTTEEHDGRRWTYQSIREMQEFFPFWSIATINRTVQNLIDAELLIVGNFNKAKYDKTRWFAINADGCAKLKSVRVGVFQNETRSAQIDTRSNQNETRSAQIETTIPESTTEITTDNKSTDVDLPDEKEVIEKPKPVKKEKPVENQAEMSEAAREFFRQWGRKRWKSPAEKDLFCQTEADVGAEKMRASVIWAAQTGISNVKAICTAARNGKSVKANINGAAIKPRIKFDGVMG